MTTTGSDAQLEQDIDRLYELPLGEFTSSRDDLAKALRASGDRAAADRVKQLRKPTVAAWLVNRLARERELDVQRLVKAGELLAASQHDAASRGAADAFAEARREEQHALERLARAAREIATREEASGTAIDRAMQTLRAASLTDEGRELLKRGRLSEELEPPGFEALVGMPPPPRERKKSSAKRPASDKRAERKAALAQARENVRELRAKERELAAKARAAQREAERAESEAARARRRATEAEAALAAAVEAREAAQKQLEQPS
jgi:hypothetical protein